MSFCSNCLVPTSGATESNHLTRRVTGVEALAKLSKRMKSDQGRLWVPTDFLRTSSRWPLLNHPSMYASNAFSPRGENSITVSVRWMASGATAVLNVLVPAVVCANTTACRVRREQDLAIQHHDPTDGARRTVAVQSVTMWFSTFQRKNPSSLAVLFTVRPTRLRNRWCLSM